MNAICKRGCPDMNRHDSRDRGEGQTAIRYAVILNGCTVPYASPFQGQVEDTYALLQNSLLTSSGSGTEDGLHQTLLSEGDGAALVFYDDDAEKDKLVALSPFASIELVKVRGYQPEMILRILEKLHDDDPRVLYFFPGDTAGSELSVRMACRSGGCSMTGVRRLQAADSGISVVRSVYANQMEGTFIVPVPVSDAPLVLSAARGVGEALPDFPVLDKVIDEQDFSNFTKTGKNPESGIFTPVSTPKTLEKARFVVAAGQGVGSKSAVAAIEKSAEIMGAEVGVSRRAAMQAWAPMERLIGASGVSLRADLCLAVGVSGAAAFVSGIEKCGFIAAVNTDPEAPIVSCADVSVIDDYQPVLDALLEILQKGVPSHA
jgi:electron transfer flavoprotein alpha subunit